MLRQKKSFLSLFFFFFFFFFSTSKYVKTKVLCYLLSMLSTILRSVSMFYAFFLLSNLLQKVLSNFCQVLFANGCGLSSTGAAEAAAKGSV